MNISTTSHPSFRRSAKALLLALLLALLGAAATTAQSLHSIGDTGTWLRVKNDQSGLRLESAEAAPRALPFAVGSVANDLRRNGDTFWLAAVEPTTTGPQIAIVEGRGNQLKRLPRLPTTGGRLLREPVLLADPQGLRAVLWLSSDTPRQESLHVARFNGQGWQDATVVAPPGLGSQIALTATVLEDGSWLAAWAAFDGEDTEIMWSRAVDGQWSTPRAVAAGNQVPDITPHLLAIRGGALLAWSRYDGNDYRVTAARFNEGVWQPAQTVGGPGTLYPTFQPGETPVLVFQQVVPAAWAVTTLDDEGQPKQRSLVLADRDDPPLVERVDAQGALLGWSDNGAKAAARMQVLWQK